MAKYLDLPTGGANYVSTPDTAVLDIVGDIDLRSKIWLANWSSDQDDHAKWGGVGARSYGTKILAAGTLQLSWSEDGTATLTQASTAHGIADGSIKWVRHTLDITNGANRVITHYKGDDGIAWDQISQNSAGVPTSIYSGTGSLLAGRLQTTSGNFVGRIYEAQVYDGIAGTLRAHFNAENFNIGDTNGATAIDATGLTWTITGSDAVIRSDQANTFLLLGIG